MYEYVQNFYIYRYTEYDEKQFISNDAQMHKKQSLMKWMRAAFIKLNNENNDFLISCYLSQINKEFIWGIIKFNSSLSNNYYFS